MSRNQKIALFTVLAAVSLLIAGTVLYEMAATRIAKGAAAPPVTAVGWMQLVLSALAAAGFSGAGIWQAVAVFIESRMPTVIQHVVPNAGTRTVAAVVDVTKLTAFLALLRQVNDDITKTKLTEAARLACDNLRDELFPLDSSASPSVPNSHSAA